MMPPQGLAPHPSQSLDGGSRAGMRNFLRGLLKKRRRIFYVSRIERHQKRRPDMKKFAADLADFLRRHYPEAAQDGWYRFSADIQIKDGEVDVEIPLLTRLPDVKSKPRALRPKADPFKGHIPPDDMR
ncbi:MAG: hypothetical protein ACXWLT_05805 [Rhizomicrobium sp.]